MRVWVRESAYNTRRSSGPKAYRPLDLSAQTFCDEESILAQLQNHVRDDDTIETVYVEMEGEKVPVVHAAELRVVAKLACIYHNALIASACQHELDLYRQPYTVHENLYDEPEITDAVPVGPEKTANNKEEEDSWDEEMHGEQRVYDETWEMNEDLVPWNNNDLDTEERYGIYM
jgi:hypothetical protein